MKRSSPPMTRLRAAIAKFLVLKLGWTQHDAAALLRVNQGRISEVITGKIFADGLRKPPAKPAQGSLNFD